MNEPQTWNPKSWADFKALELCRECPLIPLQYCGKIAAAFESVLQDYLDWEVRKPPEPENEDEP